MSIQDEDFAEPFIRRKQKNLLYFQKYRPELFAYFSEFSPISCELLITPGAKDVDLLDNGRSVYRNLALEYSKSEVSRFLDENPPSRPMWNVSPPFPNKQPDVRFAASYLNTCYKDSKVTLENYEGLYRGNIIPSVVFLGCGLGYHIEELVRRAEIIDAVVFEPNVERFALSLFTVDWEEICVAFRAKGRAISFCIATDASEENIRMVLGNKLAEIVPLYPYLNLYYNHLADVDLYRIAKDVEKDLPVVGANWGDYDFELRGFRNSIHNFSQEIEFFKPLMTFDRSRPLCIVGSGPSLDDRIDEIRKVRDNITLVTAGTGIRGLLGHGLRPDIHVELDADYMIYQMLADISEQFSLKGITLLCGSSVNPLVRGLFERSVLFFPGDNYIPHFFGVGEYSIRGCSPTCTNAALVLALAMGRHNIYLFGTDYGYVDRSQDHSKFSMYGRQAATKFARSFQTSMEGGRTRRKIFKVPGVDGSTVLTQADYFAAKRSVETVAALCRNIDGEISLRNCSDGARIEGVEWMSSKEFLGTIENIAFDRLPAGAAEPSEVATGCVSVSDMNLRLNELISEIKDTAQTLSGILRHSSVEGRRDLIIVCNQLRDNVNRVGVHSGRESSIVTQSMGWELLKGSVLRLIQVGLTHGLAHKDDEDVVSFERGWKSGFLAFLDGVPEHFASVVLNPVPQEKDPWINRRLMEAEPGFEADRDQKG